MHIEEGEGMVLRMLSRNRSNNKVAQVEIFKTSDPTTTTEVVTTERKATLGSSSRDASTQRLDTECAPEDSSSSIV